MIGTILGFGIMAFIWFRLRQKDRINEVRAFADPDDRPDSASTLVAFIVLCVLTYASVLVPMFVFSFFHLPGTTFVIAPIVAGLFIGSWIYTRNMGYVDLGGTRNIRFNRLLLDAKGLLPKQE